MTEDPDFAETMRTRLQYDLRGALKRRDALEVSALRCLIAAIDNAGAVTPPAGSAEGAARWSGGSRYVATGSGGGPSEVARRALSAEDVAGIIRKECQARETAAATLEAHGRSADREHVEISVITRYLSAGAGRPGLKPPA